VKLTIGQTSRAVGVSKTTICKHIENGKLSADWNEATNPRQREIDSSEIMRVYAVDVTVPPSKRQVIDTKKHNVDTYLDLLLKAKEEQLATLKAENERLAGQIAAKDEQLAAANRLLAAPRPEDRLAPLLEKLERQYAAMLAEPEPPAPPEKTAPAPAANRGMFAWFRGKAA
jgi:hypothetical protein